MGSSVSKPETKVFQPKAPVDYSASFLSHLENSKESDYTRAQYTENYIQERVAAELKKLEAEAIKKFQDTTTDAIEKADSKQDSFASTTDSISSLSKSLHENAKLIKVDVDESVKEARQSVVNCLKDNRGKVLNCWDEVESFKALVHKV